MNLQCVLYRMLTFYQEMFHSEKLRIRKDDVEKTRQYLKEREH